MRRRLRDIHLMNVLESLVRYAEQGHGLHFTSDSNDGRLRIAFTIDDSESFDRLLSERSDPVDSSRDGSLPGADGELPSPQRGA